jgi:hypothetical protein
VLGINSQTSARNDARTASCTEQWADCEKKTRLYKQRQTENRTCANRPSYGATAYSGPGPPHYRGFTIALRHTTLGMSPL